MSFRNKELKSSSSLVIQVLTSIALTVYGVAREVYGEPMLEALTTPILYTLSAYIVTTLIFTGLHAWQAKSPYYDLTTRQDISLGKMLTFSWIMYSVGTIILMQSGNALVVEFRHGLFLTVCLAAMGIYALLSRLFKMPSVAAVLMHAATLNFVGLVALSIAYRNIQAVPNDIAEEVKIIETATPTPYPSPMTATPLVTPSPTPTPTPTLTPTSVLISVWEATPTPETVTPITAKCLFDRPITPIPASLRQQHTIHEVVAGDTLIGIAAQYGVYYPSIRDANRAYYSALAADADCLQIGWLLIIPQP